MADSDALKPSDDAKVDIISELCWRNIYHAVEIIVEHADFQSIVKMRKVCKEWLRVIDSFNPWQKMLRRRLKDNPDFKKASDLLDWTKYIMSSDPAHRERVKYIAYVGTYLNEKQRILRRSGGEDESLLKFELDVSSYTNTSIKEMGGWLFVMDVDTMDQSCSNILAWDLSCKIYPEYAHKVFEAPDLEDIELQSKIICFSGNNESEPWLDIKIVAAGVVYSKDSATIEDNINMWIVWDFETEDVLHMYQTNDILIKDISLCSNFIVTRSVCRGPGWEAVSIYSHDFKLIKDFIAEDSSAFYLDDGNNVCVAKDDDYYKLTFNGNDQFEQSHLSVSGHITQDPNNTILHKIVGNLAMVEVSVYEEDLRQKNHFKLCELHDSGNLKCLVDKGFVEGKEFERPNLFFRRNSVLLVSDKVQPFPLEDILGGYGKGIFDMKCAKLEGVWHHEDSEHKTRESDGAHYVQLVQTVVSSSSTYIVLRDDRYGKGVPLKLTIIDLRKVKPRLP